MGRDTRVDTHVYLLRGGSGTVPNTSVVVGSWLMKFKWPFVDALTVLYTMESLP